MQQQSALDRFAQGDQTTRERLLRAAAAGRFLDEPPEPAPDAPGYRSDSTGRFVGYAIDEHEATRSTQTGRIRNIDDPEPVSRTELISRYGAPDGANSERARDRVDASASGNDTFLLADQAAAGVSDDDVRTEVRPRDTPVSADEAINGTGAVGMNKMGSGARREQRPTVGTERPPDDAIDEQDRALSIEDRERQAADAGVLDPEPADPFDMSDGGGALDEPPGSTGGNGGNGDGRQEFDLPPWTISRGQTYLNEKVYGEDRDDLEDLRDRVASTTPSEGTIELDRGEYDTFQRVVREGADEELESLEGMEANFFGDADQQREAASQARQGIINNPPEFGGRR